MSTGHNRPVTQHGHGVDGDAQHDNYAASAAAQPQAVSSAEPVNPVEEQPSGLRLKARHGGNLSERPSAQVQTTLLGCCDLLSLPRLPAHRWMPFQICFIQARSVL